LKVVGIVQARMGSSRLPGKVMKPIVGVPMLGRVMERLSRCTMLGEIVIAIPDHPRDRVICDFAKKKGYLWGIGPEEDVLGRYYKVAKQRKADAVVRLTADCPLIDPKIVDRVVARHLSLKKRIDMTSNVLKRTFPRGMGAEVLSMDCLERLQEETKDPLYREHVTNYIHDFPEKFRTESIKNFSDYSHLRLCVDTDADLKLVRRIYHALYASNPNFGVEEIYKLFERESELHEINASVRQANIFRRKIESLKR